MFRKTLPYMAFSLLAHGTLLVLLLFWRLPPEREPPQRRVLIEFSRPAAGRRPEARPQPAGPTVQPRRAVPGLPVPEGRPLALPPLSGAAGRPAVTRPEVPRRLPDASPRISGVTGAAALPSPAQALEVLAEAQDAAGPRAAAAGGRAGAGGSDSLPDAPETAGYTQETALEWKEGERTLLQPPRVVFPAILQEKGLEVDVEASFVVAPSGLVIRVEIIRSSGFASVDREVEQALRNALFAESSREDAGRIQFRFRLERKE